MNLWQKGYLYFHTVKYFRPVQLFYQLKYRLSGYTCPRSELRYQGRPKLVKTAISGLDLDKKYIERFQPEALLQNRILLLEEWMEWKSGQWQDEEKTHLWNFNLHYGEYLVALAGRYRQSGDFQYVEKFKELYLDWHQGFEEKAYPDAWHPYTASLRIVNLFICMELLGDAVGKDEKFWKLLLQDQYRTYLFIKDNEEKNLFGNHYFENLCAVYIASVFFQEDTVSDTYEKLLMGEVEEQILSDGMHYERSFMYHNRILEDLMRLVLVGGQREKKNRKFLKKIKDNMYRMAEAVHSLEIGKADENIRVPLFNDAGSNVAKTPASLLQALKKEFGYTPKIRYSFSQAGYFKLENKKLSLLFDCGKIGPDYMTGHSHCDALSFELFFKGIPVLVNAGTFQYQTGLRPFFRSDYAHNTLQVNGENQSECWGEHRTGRRMKVVDIQDNTPVSVGGVICTYRGRRIKRQIVLEEKRVKLTDRVWGLQGENNRVSSYFRLHPDFQIGRGRKSGERLLLHKKSKLQFAIEAVKGSWMEHRTGELCYYSEQFGSLEQTEVLELRQKAKGDRIKQQIMISIVEVDTDD